MIYFLLPSSPTNSYKFIHISTCANEPDVAISQSVSFYMNEIKEKIKQGPDLNEFLNKSNTNTDEIASKYSEQGINLKRIKELNG